MLLAVERGQLASCLAQILFVRAFVRGEKDASHRFLSLLRLLLFCALSCKSVYMACIGSPCKRTKKEDEREAKSEKHRTERGEHKKRCV
ncbi:hypothetical protein COCSADRAFT_206416 [Bipolaris sorokiniana ND90Pr]|uniref:Uncharacterized protein n=1 Tax=Cochliobolus sativus (strain ND90Pr / ATCC 201652) TaxID=665912 RepID=M2T3X8_COCSN|nr:uncharacterized protein COCSADRAFT_206416 [Bipolaris sorokiniana ND90Pr]EMD69115.1 hypothetical protein COCSADRAFT_206416 [Bipolaris sorokiniana ND90Pr]